MPSRKSRSLLTGAYTRRHVLQAGGLLIPAAAVIPGFVSRSAFAATTFDYYISPTGSDNNPGTQSLPWSITALNTKQSLYAGKRVGLLDGTYNVFNLINAMSHDGYTPALRVAGGTSSSPTVIAAVNTGMAVIQANNGSTYPPNNPVLGNYSVSNKEYVTVDGLVMKGSSSKCMYWGDYGAAAQNGSRYRGIKIQNCEFTGSNATSMAFGNNQSLIELAGTIAAYIGNNYFHDNIGYHLNDSDHFTATLQWFGEGNIYEYNTLINTSGFFGKEQGNFGTIIRYNYIDSSSWSSGWAAAGILDFVGTTSTPRGAATYIHHNVILAPQGANLRPSLGQDYLPDPLHFFNNTLIVQSSLQSDGLIGRVITGGANVYNNIVYSNASGDQALVALNTSAPGLINYNLYYAGSGYVWNTFSSLSADIRQPVSSFTAWKSAMGGAIDANSIMGSKPVFVGAGKTAADFKLQSGSPGIGAGRSDGTSSGSAVDIGAWGNSPPARIGCDLSAKTGLVQPSAPVLSVA